MGNSKEGPNGSREKFISGSSYGGNVGASSPTPGSGHNPISRTVSTPSVRRGLTRGISMVEQTVIDINTNLPNGCLKEKTVSSASSIGEQRTMHQVR